MLSLASGGILRRTLFTAVTRLCHGGQSRTMYTHRSSQLQETLEEEEPVTTNCSSHRDIALVGLLKACAERKDLYEGRKWHAHVIGSGLLTKNNIIANTLVHFYATSGALVKAQQVFNELLFKDVVTWTALIAGYARHGHGEKALDCFEQMKWEGVSPNEATFLNVLKACGSIRAVEKGIRIHDDIAKMDLLAQNCRVGTSLVDMYCKCGVLTKAREVFDELPIQDIVSWNTLIAGYSQNENSVEAFACIEQMKLKGLSPNNVTLASILKACGSQGARDRGCIIHVEIVKQDLLGKDIVLGTALVDMYAKCGALSKAKQVFDKFPLWDTVSCNALIAGYCQNGQDGEALRLFEEMRCKGISPDSLTFSCVLKVCGTLRAVDKGREMHQEIARLGLLEDSNVQVESALLNMYLSCGRLTKVQEIFDKLEVRDLVLWNALVNGYCQHGRVQEAIKCAEQMNFEGVYLNAVTMACILKACGSVGAAEKGKQLHDDIIRRGLLGKDVVLGNALVDMYASCGHLAKAQQVFEELPTRDVVSWNVLIAGYCQHGLEEKALECFERMKVEGPAPSPPTLSSIIKACGTIQAVEKGIQNHNFIDTTFLGSNFVLHTALVDMYAKWGALWTAQQMFDQLAIQSVISWNVLILGYWQHGHCKKAADCFEHMLLKGLIPDAVTFLCILKVCGSTGADEKGKEIHAEIARHGFLDKESVLGPSVVHMYTKCGILSMAREVLDKLPQCNVISWTSLLAGYARVGKYDMVFESFKKMEVEGIEPNMVTFRVVLHTCSCLGMVDRGQVLYVEAMISRYGIVPSVEYQNCLVDLFGLAGQFDKAMQVIEKLSYHDCLPQWLSLLDACQKWANVNLGRLAFGHVIRLDSTCGMAYVCMSNLYATAGMTEDADKIAAMGMGNA